MATRSAAKTGRKSVKVDLDVIRSQGCDGCTLYDPGLDSPQMPASGSADPVIYILGEAPGADEDSEGRQFVGRSGKLLRRYLEESGLDAYRIRWNNCCRCRPPRNRAPVETEIEHCRNSIVADIEQSKPLVLVGAGATALQWATGETTITNWRGRLIPVKIGNHACWFYPILHPSFVLRDVNGENGLEAVFSHDFSRLMVWLDVGLSEPDCEDLDKLYAGITYVTMSNQIDSLSKVIDGWSRVSAVIGFDIETVGLRPYMFDKPVDGLLSISFSDGKATYVVPISHKDALWSIAERQNALGIIAKFLNSDCVKVAHNLGFELEWLSLVLESEGLPVPSVASVGWGDTMTQAYVLDERKGCLSLDACVYQNFGFKLKAQSNIDVKNLNNCTLIDVLKYNALDAKYTTKLYLHQHKRIDVESLGEVYKLHLSRIFPLVKAQQVGLSVDFSAVDEFSIRLGDVLDDLLTKINNSKEAKFYESEIGKPLSIGSPKQLTTLFRDLLGRSEGNRPKNASGYSVDEEALSKIDLPIARRILEYRRYSKLKSTYLDGFAPTGGAVFPDGKVHTKFNDLFTVTGRLSSDSPNMQNFPKRKDAWVRAIIVATNGDVLLSADYGQIEYRILGIMADDKYIQKTLRDRYDVHRDWAERVAKADPRVWKAFGKDIKKLRSEIKNTWVFPAFYGAHADYIARMLNMNLSAARKLFDVFWSEFSGVRKWQKKILSEFELRGYVSCLTGRRRRAPVSKNQILNNVIQGSASDVVVDAMVRLSGLAETKCDTALQPVLNIHDDITFTLPEKRLDDLQRVIVHEMLHPSFDWVNVPLSVEVSVGKNWADMSPVGTFFSDEI